MLKQLSNKKQIKKLKNTIQKSLNNEITMNFKKIEQRICLQLGQFKSSKVLLNFEDHFNYITKRLERNPEDFRSAKGQILDSPLKKAGLMKVLIRTEDNRLIEINPVTKFPSTLKRFSGMIAKLLETAKIQSENQMLLQIQNDIVQEYFSNEAFIVATSYKVNKLIYKKIFRKNIIYYLLQVQQLKVIQVQNVNLVMIVFQFRDINLAHQIVYLRLLMYLSNIIKQF